MEQKIMEVLRRMQTVLQEKQLRELQSVLQMVFASCSLVEETGIRLVEESWLEDLEDFLMSKALEGKSPDTVNRYRYELNRLLSYINKGIQNITDADVSGYMRAYKHIRGVSKIGRAHV